MSRKFSPQRRNAFLAALRATGNQTLAAERAGVSLSWVAAAPDERSSVQRRRAEGDRGSRGGPSRHGFDRLGRSSGVSGARSSKPPPRWAWHDGEELVVAGRADGPRKIVRARIGQWTPRLEARFCAALRQCCNVALACRAVGLSAAAAYRHRARWPTSPAAGTRRSRPGGNSWRRYESGGDRLARSGPGMAGGFAVGPVSVAEAIIGWAAPAAG